MIELSTDIPLHPRQVHDLQEERKSKERMLAAPEYIRRQLDSNGEQVARRIRAIDRVLDDQAPKPIPATELDNAVKAEKALRAKWTQGMPTQAEMRRNPAGAVDKHMAWEKRCKKDVLAWKNLRRRLHATGISEHSLANENDVSNVEMYRPTGRSDGSHELNMHNEQIQGKTFFGLETAGPGAVMSDDQKAVLQEINPALMDQMALLTTEQRAETLKLVDEVMALRKAAPPPAEPARYGGPNKDPQHRDKRAAAKAGGAKRRKDSDTYKNSELAALRERCKAYGMNTFGMTKLAMREAIEARVAQEGSS
jgi:hypothetical protein